MVTTWSVGGRRIKEFRWARDGRRAIHLVVAVVLCGIAAAGCGGNGSAASTKHLSVAQRVCDGAQRAAHPLLGSAVHLRIADSSASDIECLLDGNGLHVDATAQASAVAWTEYDTATVHQAQAYGSGPLDQPSELPHPAPGLSGNAAWIPAKQELIATNGTESRGGSYLTVVVTRHSHHAASGLAVAAAVGRTMLASAPRGPNPGPPPS